MYAPSESLSAYTGTCRDAPLSQDFHFGILSHSSKHPAGWENKPVTWVSLEDARAYARWEGKRLPHEWEWQYAAQGADGRLYPWGNTWHDAAVPVPDKGHTMRGPDPVNAHPHGSNARTAAE